MDIETHLHRHEPALDSNDIESILSANGSEWVSMPQHAPATVGCDAVSPATRIPAADVAMDEANNELFALKREGSEAKIHRDLFTRNQPRA